MKGLFIPDITVEMFRNGCLEAIETLMAESEVYDIEYDPKSAEQCMTVTSNTMVSDTVKIPVMDGTIERLPSAEPERHYCRECKWGRCHINLDKYGRSETYWHCLNWCSGTDEEGFCHEWERRKDG